MNAGLRVVTAVMAGFLAGVVGFCVVGRILRR